MALRRLFYRTSGRVPVMVPGSHSKARLSEEAAMQLPPACSRNTRLLETEGCDDGGVVGLGVFAVDGEGCGLVVEYFVVDLRTQVVFQQVSGHKHQRNLTAWTVRDTALNPADLERIPAPPPRPGRARPAGRRERAHALPAEPRRGRGGLHRVAQPAPAARGDPDSHWGPSLTNAD